jgi:hypothetical protein
MLSGAAGAALIPWREPQRIITLPAWQPSGGNPSQDDIYRALRACYRGGTEAPEFLIVARNHPLVALLGLRLQEATDNWRQIGDGTLVGLDKLLLA